MMKLPLSILTFFLLALLGCQSGQQTETETPTDEPLQWVTYEGEQGPGKGKHIVLISGDEEYRSEEAMPQMARILSDHHGFTCTVLFAQDPEHPGRIDPNYLKNIPGLEALQKADLAFVFTRFRELPDDQMQEIENYLLKGKPVIGIRTATHAFNVLDTTSKWLHYDNYYEGEKEEWHGGFGRLVLGEKWVAHHGHHKHQSTSGIIAEGAENHPITNGIENGDVWGPTDVYRVRLPLPGDAQPIILGQVMNRAGEYDETDPFFGLKQTDSEVATVNPAREQDGNPNDPMMPVAWTKSYQLPGGQTGKSFASTIGSSTDLTIEGTRRMYVNAVYWLLGMDVPEKTNVDLVGEYNPSAYSFHDDEYWDNKSLMVSDYLK